MDPVGTKAIFEKENLACLCDLVCWYSQKEKPN